MGTLSIPFLRSCSVIIFITIDIIQFHPSCFFPFNKINGWPFRYYIIIPSCYYNIMVFFSRTLLSISANNVYSVSYMARASTRNAALLFIMRIILYYKLICTHSMYKYIIIQIVHNI